MFYTYIQYYVYILRLLCCNSPTLCLWQPMFMTANVIRSYDEKTSLTAVYWQRQTFSVHTCYHYSSIFGKYHDGIGYTPCIVQHHFLLRPVVRASKQICRVVKYIHSHCADHKLRYKTVFVSCISMYLYGTWLRYRHHQLRNVDDRTVIWSLFPFIQLAVCYNLSSNYTNYHTQKYIIYHIRKQSDLHVYNGHTCLIVVLVLAY